VRPCPSEKIANLKRIEGVDRVVSSGQTDRDVLQVLVETVKGIDVREQIYRYCVENQMVLLELSREKTSLESVFRQLTSREEI